MNDDPGPSSAARQPLLTPADDDEGDTATNTTTTPHDNEVLSTSMSGEGSSAGPARNTERSDVQKTQEKQREGLAKKHEFMMHLSRSLDDLVFAYACTLYYMEVSLFRFLLRIVPHFLFLHPKEDLLFPAGRPHLFAIFLPTALCMLAHVFFALPKAGEATRGYLHGGVMIDFIGQKPPTSKFAFLFLDLITLALQCLMLSVHQERERLKKALFPSLPTFSPTDGQITGSPMETAGESTQDHDAEERGVMRDQTFDVDNEGIELQPLNGRSSAENEEEAQRTTGPYAAITTTVDMLDIMRSGNAVLHNFRVVHTIRTVGNSVQNTPAYSLRSFGYNATLAALAAERSSRLVRVQQRQ
ncbi:DSC E3 ubiquitin ligase complex subunit 4 [Podospora australis]|uniref:DSC E3 ubiquitin ligase complex subunit 4 n=1 Tax=Podospora australis TaxID=1536484 RepID=A0AAN7APB7_9PEZI|nr:DSC E3 ubiquitin ligase complex subunit 4 [Podospora australis]